MRRTKSRTARRYSHEQRCDIESEARALQEREQLQRAALEVFLAGGDASFVDYSSIDNDSSLDDQRQMEQEAEEAYFDY